VIENQNMFGYLLKNPGVRKILFLDHGCFSATQLSQGLRHLQKTLRATWEQCTIYICIPFQCTAIKERLAKAGNYQKNYYQKLDLT
jgi:hypothetical protein